MENKNDLLNRLNEYFKDAHESWLPIKRIVERVIEEYSNNVDRCEIVAQDYLIYYDETDQQPVTLLFNSIHKIGIKVKKLCLNIKETTILEVAFDKS